MTKGKYGGFIYNIFKPYAAALIFAPAHHKPSVTYYYFTLTATFRPTSTNNIVIINICLLLTNKFLFPCMLCANI